jgi:hypothetical protein
MRTCPVQPGAPRTPPPPSALAMATALTSYGPGRSGQPCSPSHDAVCGAMLGWGSLSDSAGAFDCGHCAEERSTVGIVCFIPEFLLGEPSCGSLSPPAGHPPRLGILGMRQVMCCASCQCLCVRDPTTLPLWRVGSSSAVCEPPATFGDCTSGDRPTVPSPHSPFTALCSTHKLCR